MNFGSTYFNDYFHALDRDYGMMQPSDAPVSTEAAVEASKLGPQEVGTSTNPMQHQVQAFNAKIKEGAGKVELSFMGQGKTNSQQPGPEAFGSKEREDIRGLAEINKIKTSVHASWHNGSLAGLGKEGFTNQASQQAVHEIEKAIQFASEATKGGAVVFHTGEWQRPMTSLKGDNFTGFEAYPEEEQKTPIMVVDRKTGDIQAVRRDQKLFEPKFKTAAEYKEGVYKVGDEDKYGNIVQPDDWVDIEGNAIKKEWLVSDNPREVERLFDRMPDWNEDKTNFRTVSKEFKDFKKEAEEIKQKTGKNITAEELFFKSQLADQVSQNKGNSLFHAQNYESQKEIRDAAREALEFYESLEDDLTPEQKRKLMIEQGFDRQGLIPPKDQLPSEYLRRTVKDAENHMRYIHESSATADARAQMAMERMRNVDTMENYGLDRTANSISTLGMKALKYTEANKDKLDEPIYVAPENWSPELYGSHPEEMKSIIDKSREAMQKKMIADGYSEEQAGKKAAEHIKATIDVGHFNMWRSRFKKREGESTKEKDERFNKWLLKETEKLAKKGYIGHIHLTDNFGFDDEHVTPGQGSVPMKEFIKKMENAGLKDFIVEAGSFNATTAMPDTWAMMGSPIYSTTRAPTFRSVHQQHFGYHNPSTYIVGAYAPSNEWKLWSEVPME